MLQFLLGMLNNSTLLLFGVFVSAAILSIPFHKKNIIILFAFCIGVNALQLGCYSAIGLKGAMWWYPIVTHLPSVLLFSLYYKRKIISGLFAVMSAYLFCQLSKWLSMLAFVLTGELWAEYGLRAVITVFLGFLIIRYFASSIAVILTKPFKTVLIFSILPAAYYLFDYIATVYTNLLYSGSEVVFEFLPFVLCVAYLIFNIVYFREYEEKCEAERHNQLMEMKRAQSEKEIEAIRCSEYAVSLLRHDMRHFLNNISSYIEQGDTDKAKSYIHEIIALTDKTAMQKYCENEIVNMILSSYEKEITEKGISFQHSIQIPAKLPVSDVDFTSILSNGLENAIHAVSSLDPDKRNITLDLRMNGDKLLLSIKNPYANRVELLDGIPQAKGTGHGLGTQSIKYVAEKLNGNYQFVAKDGQFALRVVL
ncbi:MAG: GHKL domain-containing protein [Eubacteriales bacterium]|nr:GHKL domain-containing protein [Eubacteriales bacterium]